MSAELLRPPAPPRAVCILRLSAIGDVCHVVPIVRTLQHAWPETRITWVIGRVEAKLMRLLPGVEFITVDKRSLREGALALRQAMRGRHFDVLLHMQTSLRASLYSLLVPARMRLGFDRARARELQWLFTNARIAPRGNEHVLDAHFGFTEALGIAGRQLEWNLPIPDDAQAWARTIVPDGQRTLLLSACSSRPVRNWRPERYAALVEHAVRRHGLDVVLCGSPAAIERDMASAIEAQVTVPVRNIVGQDTLPQLLALLARATVLVTPDSGPAHMATMVGTPVIGLYAVTRTARTGPYLSRQWCVDRYAEAARALRGKSAERLGWPEQIAEPAAMDLIAAEDACERLDALMAALIR
mgnify:CR=1 FL=1